MTKPSITTLIPTYRRPALLKKAIQSVLSQTYPHFQLYVCDNASGDETAQVVAEFAQKDPRVKYFCHAVNIGMIGNYQFCLSLVDTEFFSFLSDDDILLPAFYETALQLFQKYPDIGFAAGSTVIMTANRVVERVPLAEWPREGKFNPPDGVLEMIGKYPVPTSILFRKKVKEIAAVDVDNSLLWDPDYLLQIAAVMSYAISKTACAIFLHHSSSFSTAQDLGASETAFHKLIQRLLQNKNLPAPIAAEAAQRNLRYLFLYRRSFFSQFVRKKRFKEAIEIAKLFYPSFKCKAAFYLFIAYVCKLLPGAFQALHLLKKMTHLRQRSQLQRQLKRFLTEESERQTARPTTGSSASDA